MFDKFILLSIFSRHLCLKLIPETRESTRISSAQRNDICVLCAWMTLLLKVQYQADLYYHYQENGIHYWDIRHMILSKDVLPEYFSLLWHLFPNLVSVIYIYSPKIDKIFPNK